MHGALTQLVTGLLVVGLPEMAVATPYTGWEAWDHTMIAIKLILAVIITILASSGAASRDPRRASGVRSADCRSRPSSSPSSGSPLERARASRMPCGSVARVDVGTRVLHEALLEGAVRRRCQEIVTTWKASAKRPSGSPASAAAALNHVRTLSSMISGAGSCEECALIARILSSKESVTSTK